MPDNFNFDHLTQNHGQTPFVRCLEDDCDFGGYIWEVNEEVRESHFLTHFRETVITVENEVGEIVYEVRGDIRVQSCRECGNEFEQVRRRGRPQLTCNDCKEVLSNANS